jgi:hypothetical protein
MAANLGVSQLEQKFRVVEYQPADNGVSAEAEESPELNPLLGND